MLKNEGGAKISTLSQVSLDYQVIHALGLGQKMLLTIDRDLVVRLELVSAIFSYKSSQPTLSDLKLQEIEQSSLMFLQTQDHGLQNRVQRRKVNYYGKVALKGTENEP